jgi:hypothetical protein
MQMIKCEENLILTEKTSISMKFTENLYKSWNSIITSPK